MLRRELLPPSPSGREALRSLIAAAFERLEDGKSVAAVAADLQRRAGRPVGAEDLDGWSGSMSADEVQAYRDTGVFNEGGRGKALAAIDACKLQRPV